MLRPAGETRADRALLTKLALAQVARARMASRQMRQTKVSKSSGISRSYLAQILAAKKNLSLYLFLELSYALRYEDDCDFVRALIRERNRRRADKQR